jgi:hypothetical protein
MRGGEGFLPDKHALSHPTRNADRNRLYESLMASAFIAPVWGQFHASSKLDDRVGTITFFVIGAARKAYRFGPEKM